MCRVFDIMLSTMAIFVLSPFLIIIFIILKFSGEGEVFFG